MGQIRIEDLEIFANHGVLSEENILGQKFIISAQMDLDIESAASDDDITNSINYADVCAFIEDFTKSNRFKLIETLADRIAIGILQKFSKANSVEVEVKKPNPPIHLHFDYVSVKVKRKWSDAYISFGSNIGDREIYINNAIDEIEHNPMCKIKNISSFFETEPYGNANQDKFINGAMYIKTILSPQELLLFLQEIEKNNGRERNIHWGPRTLDLDILLYEDNIITDDNLIVPHPDMNNRSFVLEPLCEIAPYIVHPLEKQRIIDLFKNL